MNARITRSELLKTASLRSLMWVLGLATLATAALGPIQSIGEVLAGAERTVQDTAGAVALALTGAQTSSLMLGVLGVLVVAVEYSPRTIRTTFAVSPRRWDVVLAKAGALGLIVALTSLLAVAVAVTSAGRILAEAGIDAGWSRPQVLRVAAGMVWYLVGWAMLGLAAGWLTRSKLGGAALLVLVMLVLTPLLGLVPGRAGDVLIALMPSSAGGAMISTSHADALGSPIVGFLLWTGYLVLSLAGSIWLAGRRDA